METVRTIPLPAATRRPGLDALRAMAAVLVVMLHAGVPYTIAPMPGLPWPVRHTAVSQTVDILFWGIEGFIMPLFLFLSGYGAAQTFQSKPGEFLASRWKRLGWPLVVGFFVLLPLELYIWLTGWALDGQIEWVKLRSLNLHEYHDHLWGLSHLWYLEYLLIYSLILWSGARWAEGRQSPRIFTRFTAAEILFLTVPVLLLSPEVIVGFQHGFLPDPAKFVFSGLFFFAGVAEFHQSMRPSVKATTAALLCGVLFTTLLPLIRQQALSPLIGGKRFLLAAGLAAYAILMVQTAWQIAWKSTRPTSRSVDRVAKASFWIYLVHHPLVAICHIALRPTGWPALWQFTISTATTVAIALASYELVVRRSRLGAFFNAQPRRAEPIETTPARRAA